MKHLCLITVLIALIASGCKDDNTIDPDPTIPAVNFHFYPTENATWLYSDSTTLEDQDGIDKIWVFEDAFSLGQEVDLPSSFVFRHSNGVYDTLAEVTNKYYPVLSISTLRYRDIGTPFNQSSLVTNKNLPEDERVSGWVRFDNDSFRLYSLKKDGGKYFEYLMADFSCNIGRTFVTPIQYTIFSCDDEIINGSTFKSFFTRQTEFISAIDLPHHCHLWLDKTGPVQREVTGLTLGSRTFKLEYEGQEYSM